MRVARYGAVVALGCLILLCAQAQQAGFTTRDDITMTRFSYPRAIPSIPGSNVVWPSPDGRWAAVVTSRGVLSTDRMESNILVFDLRAAGIALRTPGQPLPMPRVVASVRAYPYRLETDAHPPVITNLRWSADSKAVYFKAVDGRGNYRLFLATINGHGFSALTPAADDVGQFDVDGRSIVYTAADPGVHLIDPGQRINRDAVDITGARIQEILFPGDIAARSTELFRLYTLHLSNHQSTVHKAEAYQLLDIPVLLSLYPFRASSDATQLIDLEPPPAIPQPWTRYAPVQGRAQLRLTHGNDRRALRADNVLRPLEYALIDLTTGRRRTLVDAPNARSLGYMDDANLVAWSKDGNRVLVTNTFLPIDARIAGDSSDVRPCAVASIDLSVLKTRCFYFEEQANRPGTFHVEDIAFGQSSDDVNVLLRNGHGEQLINRYRLDDAGWAVKAARTPRAAVRTVRDFEQEQVERFPRMKIFVHQSLNDPPTLWMSDEQGHGRELWNPNPQFASLRFGAASYFQWKDDSGRQWSAVLVKPTDYVTGKRYPAVLQMYGYREGQFITDGLYPTAFAARELASAGFVVLQIQKQPDTVSEEDPRIALDGYRSAIARLAAIGMIDPRRVGVVGFSWTCWYAIYALVHDPGLFAAATIADGLDNSYMQYKLFTVEYYPLQRQMDKIRGGGPWGAHLQHWVDTASEFHLDRVETPVRIEAINPSSVLQEWGLYASLRLLHKPVDFIYFPRGTHIHQRPLERLESQQGDVDWFCFWLENRRSENPAWRREFALWDKWRMDTRAAAEKHADDTQAP